MIGHITATELEHNTTTIEITNGFLNRFILFGCRRMRLLPEGGHADPLKGSGAEKRLAANLKRARNAGQLRLDPHARKLWWEAYARLSEPIDGLAGALTARAEAHVIRLALIYALLDGQGEIESAHLEAALALWDYSAQSATWALRNSTGNPLAEQIHTALKNNPTGSPAPSYETSSHATAPATTSSKHYKHSPAPSAPTPSASAPAADQPSSGTPNTHPKRPNPAGLRLCATPNCRAVKRSRPVKGGPTGPSTASREAAPFTLPAAAELPQPTLWLFGLLTTPITNHHDTHTLNQRVRQQFAGDVEVTGGTVKQRADEGLHELRRGLL